MIFGLSSHLLFSYVDKNERFSTHQTFNLFNQFANSIPKAHKYPQITGQVFVYKVWIFASLNISLLSSLASTDLSSLWICIRRRRILLMVAFFVVSPMATNGTQKIDDQSCEDLNHKAILAPANQVVYLQLPLPPGERNNCPFFSCRYQCHVQC